MIDGPNSQCYTFSYVLIKNSKMLVSLPLAIVAALFTYFYARRKESKYKELPTTITYSGFIRRITALAIDLFILMIVLEIVIMLYNLKYGNSLHEAYSNQDFSGFLFRQNYIIPIFIGFSWLLCVLYFVLQQASHHQATLGMRIMGIKIYNGLLERANVWILLGRFLSIPLSILPFCIGCFMIIWTRRHQSIHDKLAKTVVCREW
jgi:uncharacterized RDD family membrane protein YckC